MPDPNYRPAQIKCCATCKFAGYQTDSSGHIDRCGRPSMVGTSIEPGYVCDHWEPVEDEQ